MQIVHTRLKQVKRSRLQAPAFTLLIPTWNNLPYLQLCISSIRRHSVQPHQIIVHVNEGRDGTLEWIESQPDIDYTYSDTNIGVCYALNYSRSLIEGTYVVFMNDDMYVCPGWDTALLEEIGRIGHPWFFLSSTMIEPRFTGNPSVILGDYGTSPADFREKDLLEAFSQLEKQDWMGSTWPPNVVHRDVWDLAGGYGVEFSPGMYSDPDFSMKLWEMGIRLFKGVGRSRVYHFGGKSTERVVQNKGYFTFLGKWGFAPSWLTQKMLNRGAPFTGPAPEKQPTAGQKAKMSWKRITAAFNGVR
jgi:glycosyltransferase involved in cell wall biosynthesis